MSVFKRIINLMKKPAPPLEEKTPYTLTVGDIVEISFVSYTVAGKTVFPRQHAVLFTLKDGSLIKYLKVTKRERLAFELYEPIDGRLDDINEIPTTLEMDGVVYHMEDQSAGPVRTTGDTPFSSSDEQYVWNFQSDDRKLLRIEWQDGRMMLYEGESVLPADVRTIQGS
ncbi:DUF4178 domain-containing protein [Terrilactibacillus sp. S3-3]|nr:DUF4178 domain-containing protein [Terrilactibacillus sp. S3-3]